MERDSLLAHGSSFLLQDRLFNCSDKSRVSQLTNKLTACELVCVSLELFDNSITQVSVQSGTTPLPLLLSLPLSPSLSSSPPSSSSSSSPSPPSSSSSSSSSPYPPSSSSPTRCSATSVWSVAASSPPPWSALPPSSLHSLKPSGAGGVGCVRVEGRWRSLRCPTSSATWWLSWQP